MSIACWYFQQFRQAIGGGGVKPHEDRYAVDRLFAQGCIDPLPGIHSAAFPDATSPRLTFRHTQRHGKITSRGETRQAIVRRAGKLSDPSGRISEGL
jgi:hypothetical protein